MHALHLHSYNNLMLIVGYPNHLIFIIIDQLQTDLGAMVMCTRTIRWNCFKKAQTKSGTVSKAHCVNTCVAVQLEVEASFI